MGSRRQPPGTGICGTDVFGADIGGQSVFYSLDGISVQTEGDYYVAESAIVIGQVTLRHNASIWFHAVVRGDNEPITVGENSNVQECCVLHTDPDFPLVVGNRVTIGHGAKLHGCEIGDNTLIGINAVVLNGAKVGSNCLLGSNALVTEGKVIPDNSLVLGSPGKVVRELTDEEILENTEFSERYVRNIKRYRENFRAQDGTENGGRSA